MKCWILCVNVWHSFQRLSVFENERGEKLVKMKYEDNDDDFDGDDEDDEEGGGDGLEDDE